MWGHLKSAHPEHIGMSGGAKLHTTSSTPRKTQSGHTGKTHGTSLHTPPSGVKKTHRDHAGKPDGSTRKTPEHEGKPHTPHSATKKTPRKQVSILYSHIASTGPFRL